MLKKMPPANKFINFTVVLYIKELIFLIFCDIFFKQAIRFSLLRNGEDIINLLKK